MISYTVPGVSFVLAFDTRKELAGFIEQLQGLHDSGLDEPLLYGQLATVESITHHDKVMGALKDAHRAIMEATRE